MQKRDSIPLFPCKETWSADNSKPATPEQCPSRLRQLALPNLCVVLAVLREHYKNLSEKQRVFLHNLVKRIENMSNKRSNFFLLEKAKMFLSFKSRTDKTLEASTSKTDEDEETLFKTTNMQEAKCTKIVEKRRSNCINWKHNYHITGLCKTQNVTLAINVANETETLNSYKISCIKFSEVDSEYLQRVLKVPADIRQIYLIINFDYTKCNTDRNLTFVLQSTSQKYFIERIHYLALQNLIIEDMFTSTLQLEQLMRNITYNSIKTPKYLPIYSWIKSPEVPYKLTLNIDGHPTQTVDYVTLSLYSLWQQQLIKNMELYDVFKKAARKPIQSKKSFYLLGAYHLWRLYSLHYSKVLKTMHGVFQNQHVTACNQCMITCESLNDAVYGHQVPAVLQDAVKTMKYWRKSLIQTIKCAKEAQVDVKK